MHSRRELNAETADFWDDVVGKINRDHARGAVGFVAAMAASDSPACLKHASAAPRRAVQPHASGVGLSGMWVDIVDELNRQQATADRHFFIPM